MRTACPTILSVALLLLAGCGSRQPKGPDWALSAPPGTVMAVSSQAGWALQQREFQNLLGRFPMAERTLDLFLKRAHINPAGETGRITIYVTDLQISTTQANAGVESSSFLLQLGGFRDSKSLFLAVTEAFPMEGTLQVGEREMPLYVLMDYNQFHMRLLFDEQGRIWIGDLTALAALGKARVKKASPVLRAAEWVDGRAPIQGLLLPEHLLQQASDKLPPAFAKELPKGIQAVAWSVAPGSAKDAPHTFELAITGTPEGIKQTSPWVQRLVAFISSMPGAPSRPADVMEERTRVGLKAQLNGTQLEAVMGRLAQPGLFKAAPAERKS
jgi:hypothetical protein